LGIGSLLFLEENYIFFQNKQKRCNFPYFFDFDSTFQKSGEQAQPNNGVAIFGCAVGNVVCRR